MPGTNSTDRWQLYVDTCGTFTDALARAPSGRWSRANVLSSGALRGTVDERISPATYPVTINLRGNPPSLVTFLEKLNSPDRMLVVTGNGQIARDKVDRGRGDILAASFEISALRIDPKAEIQE